MKKNSNYHKAVGLIIIVLIVGLVLLWSVTRDRLPPEIRIATALPGGLYYRFGEIFSPALEEETNRKVKVLESSGSLENRALLVNREAELAVLQAGSIAMDDVAGLVPLYEDVVHILVRKRRGIHTIADLEGRSIALGGRQSGMRSSAERVLNHYNIDITKLQQVDCIFTDLVENEELDGAIVTAGLLNGDLKRILNTGEFTLLDIPDADALSTWHAYFAPYTIPRGFYGEGPPIPPYSVHTVATMAFLAVHQDADDILVKNVLKTLYNNDLRNDELMPTLIPYDKAAQWSIFPMHEASKNYFAPFKGIDVLAQIMDSLAGAYQLLFALGAGLYVLWNRRVYYQKKLAEQEMETQRKLLDSFLEETFEVERRQKDEQDPELLKRHLDTVTSTKLRALKELMSCDLKGDRRFQIFLIQCDNLSRKIQSKLALYSFLKR